MNKMDRTKSKIEYLIILGVVIIVAFEVVAIMGGIPGITPFINREERFDTMSESDIANLIQNRDILFLKCDKFFASRLKVYNWYMFDSDIKYNESSGQFDITCTAKRKVYTTNFILKVI
jgi:hypothetical protein